MTRFCEQCGAGAGSSAKFCGMCGAPLDGRPPVAAGAPGLPSSTDHAPAATSDTAPSPLIVSQPLIASSAHRSRSSVDSSAPPARGLAADWTIERHPAQIAWSRSLLVIVGVALLAALAWWTGALSSIGTTISTQGCEAGLRQIQSAATKWDDEIKVANQTPRLSLAAQITHMQQVRRDTSVITAPSCLGDGRLFAQ